MWNYGIFFMALLAMVFAFGGVTWFFEGIALRRKIKLIENLPTSKISSLTSGLVELKGKAKWKEELYAPISGTPCVFYTYRVEQWQHRHGERNWIVIALGESGENLFYIEDDTGRVLIDPLFSEISIPINDTQEFPDYNSLPKNLKTLIDEENNQLLRSMRSRRGRLMFTETCIKTDQEIYILGTAENNEEATLESSQEDKIVIRRGIENPFFYISNRNEKEITRRMDRSAIRRIIGGPLTFAVCLFLLYLYYSFSLNYVFTHMEFSLFYQGWIIFGPVLATIFVFILGYRYYDFTKVLIRSQGT